MRHHKFLTLFAVVSFAMVLVVPVAGPAGAVVVNGCTTGMYPNDPASPSQLKVACTFTTAMAIAGTMVRIEDFPEAQWHAAAARITHADGHVTLASANVSSATGNFSGTDINRGISGTGIKAGSFIKAVLSATSVTMSQTATATTTTAVLTINYSDTRKVSDATMSGSTVTSATAHFCKPGLATCGTVTDVGDPIHGTRIPHGATITSVVSATQVTISAAITPGSGGPQSVVVSDPHTGGASLQVHDMHTTLGSKVISSVMADPYLQDPANFCLPVSGSNTGNADIVRPMNLGDPIADVDVCLGKKPAPSIIVITKPATRTTTGSVLTLGEPSYDAPLNGEHVATLNLQRALNPALVPGSPACSTNVVTGSSLDGTWQNPGSFVGGAGVASSEASVINGPILGQIVFSTSVLSFVGYVVHEKAATPGENDTSAHDDIDIPTTLLGLGACPAPSAVGVSETFQFVGTTASQATTGNGNVRALKDFPTGTTTKTSTAYVHVLNGTNTSLFTATTACTETYPGTPAFACGSG